MADLTEMNEQWEQAYLRQSYDAAVGRLFKGLIHNLNGVMQVFFMQTDLFALMIGKAGGLVERLVAAPAGEEQRLLLEQLTALLRQRTEAVRQMQEKALSCREIILRTLILPDFKQLPAGEKTYTVNSIVRTEVEFLCADSFFKHKVRKTLNLAEPLPPLGQHQLELHQILHFLLENGLEAVRGREDAAIEVKTGLADGTAFIEVSDTGTGIAPGDLARIYDPFFSTRPDRPGLGLYLARRLAGECGGAIACESRPGATRFTVTIPWERLQAP